MRKPHTDLSTSIESLKKAAEQFSPEKQAQFRSDLESLESELTDSNAVISALNERIASISANPVYRLALRAKRIAGTRLGSFLLDLRIYVKQLIRPFSSSDGYPFETMKILKPIPVRAEAHAYAPSKIKIHSTLVAPVKNEEEGIVRFMQSIEDQSYPPAEAIIVDGGSTDRTIAKMKQFAKASKVKFRIISIRSKSISQQRNLGAREANTEIIIFADAGCILDRDYCANMTGSLESFPDADLAGGIFYAADPKLEQFFVFRWNEMARWNQYLPAGKTMAVRKAQFLEAGGFPEHLPYAGEDYLFDVTFRQSSRRWIINRKAFVLWEIPTTWSDAVKKYHAYGKGDGQNGLGDYIHFRQMQSFRKTGTVSHDELGKALFEGYLEGRKERAAIEIEQRKIQGLVIVTADGLLTAGPNRRSKIRTVRKLTRNNFKVIYVASGKFRPAFPAFTSIDHSLAEFSTEETFSAEETAERYKGIMDRFSIIDLRKQKADQLMSGIERAMPGIQRVNKAEDLISGNSAVKEK
jgi:hypothetical protein